MSKIWSQLRDSINEEGFTYEEIDNEFHLLGSNCSPSMKLNKIFLKNKFIPHKSTCICGKEGITDNYYVGINRNRFVIVGSKCYKYFPCKIDFRKEYRHIKL